MKISGLPRSGVSKVTSAAGKQRRKVRASSTKAKNWDKLSAMDVGQTIANRNVYEQQQFDRKQLDPIKSGFWRKIGAVFIGIFVAILVWVGWSLCTLLIDVVSQGISSATIIDGPIGASEGTSENHFEKRSGLKIFCTVLGGFLGFAISNQKFTLDLRRKNIQSDTTDINQYMNDQHIQLPEEVQRRFEPFPDAGAHSSVVVTSMISHVMLSNKGVKKVDFAQRAEKDIIDEDGAIVYHKGEALLDGDGEVLTKKVPMFDTDFANALFEASGISEKELKISYDPTKIPYNPGNKDRDRLKDLTSWADVINKDWVFPAYEPQRPAGAYIVDSAPVNTMVLAITRAGKGQTVIEPTLDMWTRELIQNNMVINDPKGELLVKNFVRMAVRGFQVVQFNLINPDKTDIYNPLNLPVQSAREGDFLKCAEYVENIAAVFFPVDSSNSDPMWNNAANNAFKRAVYGMIDYYLELEKEIRAKAELAGTDQKVVDTQVDNLWGRVSLYNCYQFFVRLSSKKWKDPMSQLEEDVESGKYGATNTAELYDEGLAEYEKDLESALRRMDAWDGASELDLLTLFFNATNMLPRNSMRSQVANADNALRAMGSAEKMLASVYGIAITAMSFFTDPTIMTLTSGTPSQNVDLGGLSFPRRFGVRFSLDYIKRYNFAGKRAQWEAFEDPDFTKSLGKDFYHEDILSGAGWARYYFKGKFPNRVAWIRMQIVDPDSDMLMHTMYFKFEKGYQVSLSGRKFIKDPITKQKVVKNGYLVEYVRNKRKGTDKKAKKYVPGDTTFQQMKLENLSSGNPNKVKRRSKAITAITVHYSEQPKAVFLVTPPHLMKYAKLILILVKQLVDLNFDKSYTVKPNQKPLYKTRYMLDELGNLQSDGHGIADFQTMLSIGLGQGQEFTLILQTLQQLRDVYGDSVDKIVQGNAQPLSAKIATPGGWIAMGEIEDGTEILVPAGGSAKVNGVYPQGVRPVYEIVRADGSRTEACDEHLWEIEIEVEGERAVA